VSHGLAAATANGVVVLSDFMQFCSVTQNGDTTQPGTPPYRDCHESFLRCIEFEGQAVTLSGYEAEAMVIAGVSASNDLSTVFQHITAMS
jgi:hypothetical protein